MEEGSSGKGSPETPVVLPAVPWLVDGNQFEPYLESCLAHIKNQDCPEATILPPYVTEAYKEKIVLDRKSQMGFLNGKLNEIINYFQNTDASLLWIVDADNEVPPNALSKLLSWDADLASGISPGHGSPNHSTVMRWMPPPSPEMPWSTPYYKPLLMNEVLGKHLDDTMYAFATGHFCLLTKRRVYNWLRFQWSPEQKLGNEIVFWEHAQNLGLKCVIDGTVLCGHLPEHPLVDLQEKLGWSN